MERYDREHARNPNGMYDAKGNQIYDENGNKIVSGTVRTPKTVTEDGEAKPAPNVEKAKLQKKRIKLILAGGLTTAALFFSSWISIKVSVNHKKYQALKDSDQIRTGSVLDLVDKNKTSVDELIENTMPEFNEYEKYRNLVNLRSRYIDSKLDYIKKYESQSYDVDVDTINLERVEHLSNLYYDYRYEYGVDKCESHSDYAAVCTELNSILNAINQYEAAYGQNLVETMTETVLASKVVDAENLNPDNVSNINSKYKENGKLKVTFDYDNNGKTQKYTSTFKNDGYIKPEEIAKDLAAGELQKAIQDTNILAYSSEYDELKTKTR